MEEGLRPRVEITNSSGGKVREEAESLDVFSEGCEVLGRRTAAGGSERGGREQDSAERERRIEPAWNSSFNF